MSDVLPAIPEKKIAKLLSYFKKNNMAPPTVIVIGAGIAGVSAAKELTKNGIPVILLEGRDRTGGRLHSTTLANGAHFELGAQFFHGLKDNPLFPLAQKYGLEIKPYSREDWGLYDVDGNEIGKINLEMMLQQYKTVLRSLSSQRRADNKDRFLVRDIQDMAKQLPLASDEKLTNLSKLAKIISVHEFTQESLFAYKTAMNKEELQRNFLVTNGYHKIIDGLLEEAKATGLLTVHLLTTVAKIHHTSSEITVTSTTGQTFVAHGAICTLPLGVLQQGNVHFDPLLPAKKMQAINSLQCAVHNKVILQYNEVFWDNRSHFLILFDYEMGAWIDMINLQYFSDQKAPIIIASIHTDLAEKNFNDQQLISHFENILKNMYPSTFKPLKEAYVTHWDTDPYSLGSYSFHPEGSSLDDNSEIAVPIGRLLFAGEHTYRSPSNLQGAYLSGLEAAQQAVEQLYQIYRIPAGF
jgi:monoamine oxidase